MTESITRLNREFDGPLSDRRLENDGSFFLKIVQAIVQAPGPACYGVPTEADREFAQQAARLFNREEVTFVVAGGIRSKYPQHQHYVESLRLLVEASQNTRLQIPHISAYFARSVGWLINKNVDVVYTGSQALGY